MDEAQQFAKLEQFLKPKRLDHCRRVSVLASELAEIYGVDRDIARLAGIFHDVAKYQSPESLLDLGISSDKVLSDIYENYASVWHAFVGPTVLQVCFDFDEPSLLSAVRWHTTGTSNMSLMDQILFVADYCEPGRSKKEMAYVRTLMKTDLNESIYAISFLSVMSLVMQGRVVHPETIACLNDHMKRVSVDRLAVIREELKDIVCGS